MAFKKCFILATWVLILIPVLNFVSLGKVHISLSTYESQIPPDFPPLSGLPPLPTKILSLSQDILLLSLISHPLHFLQVINNPLTLFPVLLKCMLFGRQGHIWYL